MARQKIFKLHFILVAIVSTVFFVLLFIFEANMENIYRKKGIDFTNDRHRYIKLQEAEPEHVDSQIIFLKGEPVEIRFSGDKDGFIEPSKIHPKPDFTILFLGGSTTLILNVHELDRFPYLVGQKLGEKLNIKVNSINGSFSATNSFHSIFNLLAKGIPQNPDLVVLMHNLNDLRVLGQKGQYWQQGKKQTNLIGSFSDTRYSKEISLLKTIKNHSIPYTWNFFRTQFRINEVQNKTEVGGRLDDAREWISNNVIPDRKNLIATQKQQIKLYRSALKSFIEIAKAFEIAPALMTEPTRGKFPAGKNIEDTEFFFMHRIFNQEIRDIAAENTIIMIDLAKHFERIPNAETHFKDKIHAKASGSKIIADKIVSDLSSIVGNIVSKRRQPR